MISNYGQAQPGANPLAFLTPAAEAAGVLLQSAQSPYQRAAVLEGQLRTAIAEGRPLRTIEELRAKLAAAQREAQQQAVWDQSQQRILDLTQLLLVAGVAVGGAVAVSVLLRALR